MFKKIHRAKKIAGFILAITLIACGSNELSEIDASVAISSVPIVTRVDPNVGQAGDTVTIFGFGFSQAPANNILIVGGKGAAAESYAIVNPPISGEIESITFKVPAGASVGTGGITVIVFENSSNSNIEFTINP